MNLNIKALALACGIIWGAAVFLVGIANLIWAGYGEAFLNVIASLYPGYSGPGGVGAVVVGGIYALVDGAAGGVILGWLYNLFAGS